MKQMGTVWISLNNPNRWTTSTVDGDALGEQEGVSMLTVVRMTSLGEPIRGWIWRVRSVC